MLSLALTLWVAAAPNVRVTYELKCLYCHSAEVSEGMKLTEPGWVKLIEQMRRKAPVLISRRDVKPLARYMAREKGLVPPPKAAPKPPVEPPPVAVVEPVPEPVKETPVAEPAVAAPEPDTEADAQLEQQAFALMQQRCSKCHTLARVYQKLSSLESALSIIERMQLKTGSGITARDSELLERYVRAQFSE